MIEDAANLRSACPDCAASARGLCSACLLEGVFADDHDETSEASAASELADPLPGLEIRRFVGRGGMGAVYEAWEPALDRRVAVKLLPPDLMAREDFFDRFQREARVMARLDHPRVARVFGTGVADSGQAYIIMEFLEGEAVIKHVADHESSVRERLDLFLQVAEGVEHAHQKGVVHRDLKPSNILVTEAGSAKVIDFGLAKAVAEAGDGEALWLSAKATGGTPGYMSPEQLAGQPSDTRADVYSLGVLLRELLEGQPAARGNRLEWDAIIGKATENDPDARYASVGEMAEDLRRHLTHLPLRALPIKRWRRAAKFHRRHRLGLSVTYGLAVLALLGLAAILRESFRARQAERAAAAELRRGEQLIEFMLDELHDKLKPVGRLDVLESTAVKVGEYYAEPGRELRPESMRHRARAVFLLGKIRGAQVRPTQDLFQESIQLYDRAVAAAPEETEWLEELTQAWNSLAVSRHFAEDWTSAEETYLRALEVNARALAKNPANPRWRDRRASILHNLGSLRLHRGRLDEAARSYEEALTLWRKLLGEDSASVDCLEHLAVLHQSRAQLHEQRGQLDLTRSENAEALALRRRVLALSPDDPDRQTHLADILQNISEVQVKLGELDAAETAIREYRAIREKLVALDPENAGWRIRLFDVHFNEGNLREKQGRPALARSAFRKAVAIGEALLKEGRASREVKAALPNARKKAGL